MEANQKLYGLMAEFKGSKEILEAARRTYGDGYRKVDAFSPMPVHGLAEALGFHYDRVPLIVLIGGVLGGSIGFALQYWVSVINYPLNVGGRPLFSWPAFVPVTFEMTILIAALSAIVGMLALNGLPRPHHPVFSVPSFERASQDRYFLLIEAEDVRFDPEKTREFLKSLEPVDVTEVEG